MTDPLPYSEDEMYWDAVLGEDEPNPDDHCGSCGHDKYDASDFGCQYCDYRIANTVGMSEEEASEYLSQFVMTDTEAAEWLNELAQTDVPNDEPTNDLSSRFPTAEDL